MRGLLIVCFFTTMSILRLVANALIHNIGYQKKSALDKKYIKAKNFWAQEKPRKGKPLDMFITQNYTLFTYS